MRGYFLLFALSAAPGQAQSFANGGLVSGLEARAGHRHRGQHDHDVRPDFRQPCVCRRDNCPSFLSRKANIVGRTLTSMCRKMCECKGAAAQACYIKSERGCPAPRAKVSVVVLALFA
ncbi:hypothetical protein V8F20_011532 [Naviculisporaceae sp. PSN 640]